MTFLRIFKIFMRLHGKVLKDHFGYLNRKLLKNFRWWSPGRILDEILCDSLARRILTADFGRHQTITLINLLSEIHPNHCKPLSSVWRIIRYLRSRNTQVAWKSYKFFLAKASYFRIPQNRCTTRSLKNTLNNFKSSNYDK